MTISRIEAEPAEESSLADLFKMARTLSSQKKDWHFHIFMPACRFNKSGQYVLYFENTYASRCYCHHSDTAPLAAGKVLAQLLHKFKIGAVAKKTVKTPARAINKIIGRANHLNKLGRIWHHHMFFPKCHFNNTGRWLILFEDEEAKTQLRQSFAVEPNEELHLIENLYYQSKH